MMPEMQSKHCVTCMEHQQAVKENCSTLSRMPPHCCSDKHPRVKHDQLSMDEQ